MIFFNIVEGIDFNKVLILLIMENRMVVIVVIFIIWGFVILVSDMVFVIFE